MKKIIHIIPAFIIILILLTGCVGNAEYVGTSDEEAGDFTSAEEDSEISMEAAADSAEIPLVSIEDTVDSSIEDTADSSTEDTAEISTQDATEILLDDTSELSIEELDYIHSVERAAAAKPYEKYILPEFKESYEQNEFVVGHIYIEGTDVDCPVLQKLEDYEFYLTHDMNDEESAQGCIILDADSEIGIGTKEGGYLAGYEPSTNQLVHGHNMKSGTMFGSLFSYASEEYAMNHRYIVLDSLYEHRIYTVILAFYSEIYPHDADEFMYYNFNQANSKAEFDDWYSNVRKLALYELEDTAEYGDEMITLSTCSYHTENGRFAVVGRRIE